MYVPRHFAEPDPERGLAGGRSGLLFLDAGDRIEWECEVHNRTDHVLRFANEAYDAEMCITFGSTPEVGWFCLGERQ